MAGAQWDAGGLEAAVRATIRDVPDFPKPGIVFKDITPVLADPALFSGVLDWMAGTAGDVDVVVGVESRGFLFASGLVDRLGARFVPARKAGKLPWRTIGAAYALEYGEAEIEVHEDAIQPGDRVLLIDDLIATGGTATAAVDLVERLGGKVLGATFLIELSFLPGARELRVPARALVTY